MQKVPQGKINDRMEILRVAIGIGVGNIASISTLLIRVTFVRNQHLAFRAFGTGFAGFFVAGFHQSGFFGTAGFLGT